MQEVGIEQLGESDSSRNVKCLLIKTLPRSSYFLLFFLFFFLCFVIRERRLASLSTTIDAEHRRITSISKYSKREYQISNTALNGIFQRQIKKKTYLNSLFNMAIWYRIHEFRVRLLKDKSRL